MTYITCSDYTKKLGRREVLDHINLEIEAGECVGLWGINASGKTMLLRALAGLILPDSGSVVVGGKKLTPRNRFPDSLGLIIEHLSFWPYMTGKETLETIASIKKIADAKRICESLELVGLDPSDPRTVKKYSLGMLQKLAIAQAILERPKLLLLDEPTNALDVQSREKFNAIVRSELDHGTTIVLSSHHREDLKDCCHRILTIENGSLMKD